MIRRLALAAVPLLVAALIAPAAASADGDPASDFLLVQRLFVPFHRPDPALVDRLEATVYAADRSGYPLRVAVVGSRSDLGAIPQLFGNPRTYAQFLGQELKLAYHGHLLVVMPAGYGASRNGLPDRPAARAVAALPAPTSGSSDDLATAAIAAVRRLSAAAGHPLPANPPPAPEQQAATVHNPPAAAAASSGGGGHALLIAGAVIAAGLLAAAVVVLVARRRSAA